MLISQLFKILGQNLSNFFVGILVETMTPKGHFEINWPLVGTLGIFVTEWKILGFYGTFIFEIQGKNPMGT